MGNRVKKTKAMAGSRIMSDYKDYQEEIDKKNNPISKIFNNVRPFHIFIIVGVIYVVSLIQKSGKNNTFLYLAVGGGFLLFLFASSKSETNRQIPRGLAQEIAFKDLKSEIRVGGSYPLETKIFPTSYFKDKSIDIGEGMKLFKYYIGFKIKLPSSPEKSIVYEMAPFTGECKGIVEMPMGFNGQEIKDIQLVFPETSLKTETKPNQ